MPSMLDVDAAGIMLANPSGNLRVLASSSETMRFLELFELRAQEGPCVDCYQTGAPVGNIPPCVWRVPDRTPHLVRTESG